MWLLSIRNTLSINLYSVIGKTGFIPDDTLFIQVYFLSLISRIIILLSMIGVYDTKTVGHVFSKYVGLSQL